METDIYKVPVWALDYLIYHDIAGLEDDDKDLIDGWLKNEGITEIIEPYDIDEFAFFCERPAFGEPCRVVECECVLD